MLFSLIKLVSENICNSDFVYYFPCQRPKQNRGLFLAYTSNLHVLVFLKQDREAIAMMKKIDFT